MRRSAQREGRASAPAGAAAGTARRWLPFLLVVAVYAVAVAQNITLPESSREIKPGLEDLFVAFASRKAQQ